MEIVEKYGLLVLAWFIFGLIHSIMASKKIKASLRLSDLNYRRFYIVQSIVLVLAILGYGATIAPNYFLDNAKANKAIGLMFATFGYLMLKLAFKQMSLSAFLGYKAAPENKLITTGVYARVRHPLYTATLLMIIGFIIFSPSYTNMVHAICAFFYIIIGVLFEEGRLEKEFGDEYVKYKKHTPMLVPSISNKHF